MARSTPPPTSDALFGIVEQLIEKPHTFDFFQAVRLLERTGGGLESSIGVGQDGPPPNEPVRFRVLPTLQFPPGMIVELEERQDFDARPLPPEISVALYGLLGPLGALPRHYTELAADRASGLKDETLPRFLDIVQNRMVGLFYRAWLRHRIGISTERSRTVDTGQTGAGVPDDMVTHALLALIGTDTLNRDHNRRSGGEQVISDDALLYYSGRLLAENGSAESVGAVLTDYFGLPVEVVQFQGRWIALPLSSQTSMTPQGRNCGLGTSAVSGSRVWDQTSLIRIRVGPLTRSQFDEFLPGESKLEVLSEWVRRLVGAELDVDVQLVLRAEDVPLCAFDATAPSALGRNTWSKSSAFDHDAEDVVVRLHRAAA